MTAATGTAAAGVETRRVPGETGMWVLVLGEMTMFAILFGAFLVSRNENRAVFAASRAALNQDLGAVDTVLLLTSSLLVAVAVRLLRHRDRARAAHAIVVAGLCGVAFAVLKGVEYVHQAGNGTTPLTNDFFMYFYTLTGLHLLHLVVGMVLLAFVWRSARRPAGGPREELFVECAASYWHMVDLIWVVLFPLLYLVCTP